ncbi:MAG TPA: hypothetical protein VHE34_27100 [Puia sp.]|uniref:hypothetical protein n=1 Tax=Puia sp. TaxID=2045100 RepID=UPI002C8943ED|nr:hypothetical protein [Puia sp.]HVU98931.1 hypothetical protein [Puia sp.]
MSSPLISIVIPVKNGAPWLEKLFRGEDPVEGELHRGLKKKFRWLRYNYGLNSAYRRAVREFNSCLAIGESFLDSRHSQICGVAPQAPKPIVPPEAPKPINK